MFYKILWFTTIGYGMSPYLYNNLLFSMATKMTHVGPGSARIHINWPSESVVQDYGSADPDPYKIFLDPEHCLNL